MKYMTRKPYLFLDDRLKQPSKRHDFFEAQVTKQDNANRKLYSLPYPDVMFEGFPVRSNMNLVCKPIVNYSPLEMDEEGKVVFEITKEGKFYEEGFLFYELDYNRSHMTITTWTQENVENSENSELLHLRIIFLSGAPISNPIALLVRWLNAEQKKRKTLGKTPISVKEKYLETTCYAEVFYDMGCDDYVTWNDDFNDGVIDPVKWVTPAHPYISEAGGKLLFRSLYVTTMSIRNNCDFSCFIHNYQVHVDLSNIRGGGSTWTGSRLYMVSAIDPTSFVSIGLCYETFAGYYYEFTFQKRGTVTNLTTFTPGPSATLIIIKENKTIHLTGSPSCSYHSDTYDDWETMSYATLNLYQAMAALETADWDNFLISAY